MRYITVFPLLLALIITPLSASAFQFKAGEQLTIPSQEVISEDFYVAGGAITSEGPVGGDFTLAGGNLLVGSSVSQDLVAVGGSITVTGDVSDDFRAAGGTIVLQSAVAGDALIAGGQVTLSGSGIGGDVAVGAGALTITAPIAKDLRVGAGEVLIDSEIGGNVRIFADRVVLGENARILGDLTYDAVEEATIADGAEVNGEIVFTQTEGRHGSGVDGDAIAAGIVAFFTFWLFAKFLMILAGALVIGLMFKRYAYAMVTQATDGPWGEIGRGLIFFIVVPLVSIVLLVTVIGIPIGILGLLAFGLTMWFATLAAPIIVGSVIHKWIRKPALYVVSWKTILLGVVVFFLLGLVPFFGWLIVFVITLMTLGASLKIKWDILQDWR